MNGTQITNDWSRIQSNFHYWDYIPFLLPWASLCNVTNVHSWLTVSLSVPPILSYIPKSTTLNLVGKMWRCLLDRQNKKISYRMKNINRILITVNTRNRINCDRTWFWKTTIWCIYRKIVKTIADDKWDHIAVRIQCSDTQFKRST